MSYKTILTYVDGSIHMPERIRAAATLARRFGAHLTGMAATALPGAFYLPGVIGESSATLIASLEYLKERADASLSVFEAAAEEMAVPSFDRLVIEDEAAAALCMQARFSDLVVIGQPDPAEELAGLRKDFPEYVIMHASRPVLVVPHAGRFAQLGKRIVIAWDGSAEAARAVSGALPLLKEGEAVQICVFNTRNKSDLHDGVSAASLATYLARHEVRADVTQQPLPAGFTVGDALLAYTSAFDADLLVMGGYAHSRFREVLVGGATRTLLHAMTVPTLLSH